ncbi:MAG: slipin family protein [Spirochaetia bacterium]
MNLFQEKVERIKNAHKQLLVKDFQYNVFSYLMLAIFLSAAVGVQFFLFPETASFKLVVTAVCVLAAGGLLTIVPMWISVIQFIVLAWVGLFAFLDLSYTPLIGIISIGLLLSASIQLVYHWDKVVILRLGKFKAVHDPGLFFLIPLMDRTADFVDTRIRVTDFSAEKTITRDTVPVHVDALAFWMIWDAKKAILEVENFLEAVVLSAQTALRDSIGRHDLSELLSERDKLGKEIQRSLDAKTSPWGITILSIEFTDIIIPQALEDAMSKRAQAERERQSRVILGTAEVEIAEKFEKAAERYKDNPTALQLRAMNMVYEGLRSKGALMLLPSSALESMNLGTALASYALKNQQTNSLFPENAPEKEKKQEGNKEDHNG